MERFWVPHFLRLLQRVRAGGALNCRNLEVLHRLDVRAKTGAFSTKTRQEGGPSFLRFLQEGWVRSLGF
jgi:hypothetical protein